MTLPAHLIPMKTQRLLRLVALTLSVSAFLAAPRAGAAENTLTDAEKAAGWQLLFDGKTWNLSLIHI